MPQITHGMNLDQVRQLARQLDQKATQLEQIISETRNVLNNVAWEGPDARRFKQEWQSRGIPALNRAKDILTETSRAAARNADQQQQTSQA